MTLEQCNLIAKLLRSPQRTAAAVRLVLVNKLSPTEAALKADISPQSVTNALARYRRTHQDIIDAYQNAGTA